MTATYDSPSKVVKARRKFLINQQKLSVNIDDLIKIKKQLDEVEYLLTRYSNPTTRKKINTEDGISPIKTPVEILEARHNNILLHLQESTGDINELYKKEKELEQVQTLLSKYIEPATQRLKGK